VPLFPILGIVVCAAMIVGLGWTNWLRLGVWLVIGLAIYFGYGRKHSKLRAGITVNVGGGGPVTAGERPPPSQ